MRLGRRGWLAGIQASKMTEAHAREAGVRKAALFAVE
jgi:hypothetical protein